jgi:hypothetical protein
MRILYLDIDTLRPDHLGCYGYHRDTSPAMQAGEPVKHCGGKDVPQEISE